MHFFQETQLYARRLIFPGVLLFTLAALHLFKSKGGPWKIKRWYLIIISSFFKGCQIDIILKCSVDWHITHSLGLTLRDVYGVLGVYPEMKNQVMVIVISLDPDFFACVEN